MSSYPWAKKHLYFRGQQSDL